MKKVIKKTVAKTPVKKTAAKKPMMKSGGVKKLLKKAQYGDQVKEGPLSEEDTKKINKYYQANVNKANKFFLGSMPSVKGYSYTPSSLKEDAENTVRMSPTFNTSKTNLKKGGVVKKATAKKVMVKSKKK
jgi:hypothetical protein